ncbi:MAG TPA: helix-turn-helix transcriptional regulator [Gemmatimonadaceae bacterium]|jgi:DNA-binding Xre family transcriptional regulator
MVQSMETLAHVPTRFRLQELLEQRKPPMSQTELAKKAGLSFATVNRLCTNATSQVSLETLDKLADVLGVEPGELLEREGKRRKGR